MNLKRMILHAMLPAMMLGVFSLLAAPASAASKKKLKAQPIRVACVGNSITYGTGLRTVPATLIHRSFSVCWATSM